MNTELLYPSRVSSLARLNRRLAAMAEGGAKFFILLDENTYNHCLPTLVSRVDALQEAVFFELPVGEEAKRLAVAEQLWASLMESGADRNSVIVNLGGGCVTDVGGFVAAAYRRGIRYVNVPTSLIGMVDAAIGGKTAVDVGCVKNQVGFFHQPTVVCLYPDFLRTLPQEELVSGLFEIVKTLLLSDAQGLQRLESALCKERVVSVDTIAPYVAQCADCKSSVVAADPMEQSVRKVLNLGHSFGHGIEGFMMENRTPVKHGVAVGLGLACALYLSVKKLGMRQQLLDDYCSMLHTLVEVPRFTLREAHGILCYMRQDKKNHDGLILCVLLQDVGSPVIDVAVDETEVLDALLRLGKL